MENPDQQLPTCEDIVKGIDQGGLNAFPSELRAAIIRHVGEGVNGKDPCFNNIVKRAKEREAEKDVATRKKLIAKAVPKPGAGGIDCPEVVKHWQELDQMSKDEVIAAMGDLTGDFRARAHRVLAHCAECDPCLLQVKSPKYAPFEIRVLGR